MTPLVFAFLAGGAVLALELLGARLAGPFYGATVYVWTALITVTLAALAAGYAAGGRLAARPGSPWRPLAGCLGAAGLWLFAVPFARGAVLRATSGLELLPAALSGFGLLLAAPLALLGCVGPLCVRLRAGRLEELGRAAGGVYAVSTLGSVAGALGAGYWLLPRVDPGLLLAALGALLLTLSGIASMLARPGGGPGPVVLGAGVALASLGASLLSYSRADPRVRWRAQSLYGEVKVIDLHGDRFLFIDGITNTVISLQDGESSSEYIRSFELLPAFRPAARRALLIGLGGGAVQRNFDRYYGIPVDVVDIDPAVAQAAMDWFGYQPTGTFSVDDGRRFLERGGPPYDFLILDAFAGDQHPYHLFSREAAASAAGRLAPDGVLAINLIGYAHGPRSLLWRSVARTFQESFPYVRAFVASPRLDSANSFVNIVLFVSRRPLEFGRDPARSRPVVASLWEEMRPLELPVSGPALRGAHVLTDDYNPIDDLSKEAFRSIRLYLMRYQGELLAL